MPLTTINHVFCSFAGHSESSQKSGLQKNGPTIWVRLKIGGVPSNLMVSKIHLPHCLMANSAHELEGMNFWRLIVMSIPLWPV